MLIDEVEVVFRAGHGGPGRVSFYVHQKGPDGGDGGKGGDIYVKVTSDYAALNRFSRSRLIEAESGTPGAANKKSGKNADDLTIRVPIGTTITDLDSGDVIEINDLNQHILIARGGKGGKGNFELRSSIRTTPMIAQPGLKGEVKRFKFQLKFLSDYGLIGLPNSGKSSLLNELTSANSRVGDYPFTTLEANLGVLGNKVIADIPGLIEGASEGKGLGIKFLKHIEKVTILLHCISGESKDPLADYKVIRDELGSYNKDLLKKKEIILLTKSDLLNKDTLTQKMLELKVLKKKIIPVSIHDYDSIELLKNMLAN